MAAKSVAERLAALEERFAYELLPEGERLELRERINKLKKTEKAGRALDGGDGLA